MKVYRVDSYRGWYVVKARNKREARSDGVQEFGRGMVKDVKEATQEDIDYYLSQKGEISEVQLW